MTNTSKPNYYEFFGLANFESDQAKIKAAYRSMALKWHPDRHLTNKDHANFMMKQVNEVYKILSTSKISYDDHLRRKMGTPKHNPFSEQKREYTFRYSPFGAAAGEAVFDFEDLEAVMKKYQYGAQQEPKAKGRRRIKELPLTEQRIFIDCILDWTVDELTSAKNFINRRRMKGGGR